MTTIEINIEQLQNGRVSCTLAIPAKQSFLPAEIEMANTIARWLTDKFISNHNQLGAAERSQDRVNIFSKSDFGGKGHVQHLCDLYTQSHYAVPLTGDQAEQIKGAFYAGALSNFKLLKDAGNCDFKEAATTLTAIEAELLSYFKNRSK